MHNQSRENYKKQTTSMFESAWLLNVFRYEADTLECQLHCNLTVKGKYKSSGHLLLFPIEGHGESIVKCSKFNVLTTIREFIWYLSSDHNNFLNGRLFYHVHVDIYIFSENVRIHYIIKLGSKVRSDGHSHLYIQSVNYDHSYDGRVSYSMTKLFRGNPEISKYLKHLFTLAIFMRFFKLDRNFRTMVYDFLLILKYWKSFHRHPMLSYM